MALTAPTRDSELTSGFTRRAIRFVLIRVGVNSSETPNGLYVTVICPAWFPGVGIGISPPARKLAVRPLAAVKFGSARIVIIPLRCIAPTRASTCCHCRQINAT